ncbi:MAG: prenyltransferase [Lactobacillaceae bacterium]|nr:prenyltransferase [Lactobacillaceae bacterium]
MNWLNWKTYAAVTEISHAPLNAFWFIFGTAYAWYNFHQINVLGTIIGLIFMILFDGATNTFNNYMDYIKAKDITGYQQKTSTIGTLNLPANGVKNLAIALYTIAGLLGLIVIFTTRWPVMIFGLIGYFVAVQYSVGLRLNGTPFGEFATGMSIGFIIPATVVYINTHSFGQVSINFAQFSVISSLLLAALPLYSVMLIGSFGNNASDLEEDLANGRKTLVFYMGKPATINLIKGLLILGPISTIPLVILHVAPWLTLLTVAVLPKVWRAATPFFAMQDKRTTFRKLFKAISLPLMIYPITFALGTLIQAIWH